MAIKAQISTFYESLIDFSIGQRSPHAKKLSKEEQLLLSELALSTCHTAINLVSAGLRNRSLADTIFISGALLFDVLQPKAAISEWTTVAESDIVQSNPRWHFKILIGLLNVSEDPEEVLRRVLSLKLGVDDLSLRERMIESVLMKEIRLSPSSLKRFALQVHATEWDSSHPEVKRRLQEEALKIARR